MQKIKVAKGFNTWVKVKRQKPSTVGGLYLPDQSQSGRSLWFMDQDLESLDLKEGDQILPAPETWFYKVNPDDETDDDFMMKEEHILAIVA